MTRDIPVRVQHRAHAAWSPEGECRRSRYSLGSHGYAQIGWQDGGERVMVLAHVAAWTLEHGRVPAGMSLDHECRNRWCVRTDHLRLITFEQNSARHSGDDWPLEWSCKRNHGPEHRGTDSRG